MMQRYGALPGVRECGVGFEAEIEGLAGRYAEPEGVLLLALDGGQPVGCGALRLLVPGICEMKRLYLEPAARGSGAGRALVVALIETGRVRGYRAMRLDTLSGMQRAIALYRSLGFQPIERYDAGSPADALYFELAL